MKNLKSMFLAIVLTFLVGTVMQAQEKTKELKDRVQSQKTEQQLDAEDAKMKEMFKKAKAEAATAEEREMIAKKQAAYEQARANKVNTYENKDGELKSMELNKKQAQLSKRQLYEAYDKSRGAEATIEQSSNKIKEARERLELAKKSNSLSADAIAEKEAKIATAEKELKEAKEALHNQRRVIKEKHAELDGNN